jgi:hypothetical protein
LIIVPGLAAWLTGQPLIFPSLGPTAFALVFDLRDAERNARQAIGSHLVEAVSGLIAYRALAQGLILAALRPAFSMDGFRVVASGVISIGLATLAMVALRLSHAPACATTLIVSLGVLPTATDGILIMAAVIGMFLVHRLITRIWP